MAMMLVMGIVVGLGGWRAVVGLWLVGGVVKRSGGVIVRLIT